MGSLAVPGVYTLPARKILSAATKTGSRVLGSQVRLRLQQIGRPPRMRRSTSAVGWSTSDRLAGSVEDEDVLRAPETPEETGPFLRRQFYKP